MRFRCHFRGGSLVGLSLAAVVAGCSSPDASIANFTYEPPEGGLGGSSGTGGGGGANGDGSVLTDAPFGDVELPPGGGLGQVCSDSTPCRAGLQCGATGMCEAGHSLAQGSPCVTSVECQSGLYCSALRQCAPEGKGTAGTTCLLDSECTADLKCGLVGFSAQCVPAGTVDFGGTCTTGTDCLGGLVCAAGKCAFGTPGLPGFLGGGLWPGDKCEAETGAPVAWFRIPRGTGDGDFYRLPFPNDIRMKNGHPDLTGHPTPGASLLGYDLVDRVLRAVEQDNDGFGTYPTVFFRFNTADIDFHSLDAPADAGGQQYGGLWYLDVTSNPAGTFLGWYWNASWSRGKYICDNWIGIRPPQGNPLEPGHTYVVVITAKAKTKNGQQVGPTDDFRAMVASTAPDGGAELAAAYTAYKPLRDMLAARAVDPTSIIDAAVFTVGHVADRSKNVAAAAAKVAPPASTTWVKCGAGVSPCPDVTGTRACGTPNPNFDEYQAVLPMPIFQKGTAPYLQPNDGGDIPALVGEPAVARTDQVCASLTVPAGVTMPAGGWPLVIYAHGTGGDFRSHIREGVADALATASTGSATVPMAVLGIDQVQNGARRAGSTLSPNNLFYNFANPRAARDNALQGAADQISLANIAASIDVDATGDAGAGAHLKIDPNAIVFWGHSQGATEGGLSIPFSTRMKAAVFTGQGAGFLNALLSKTKPENVAAAIPIALQDPDPSNPLALAGGEVHPVLSLVQMLVDPADPLNFARAATMAPPQGITGHHVFQVYGLKDSYAPPVTEATYAIAGRLGLVAHDPSASTPDPLSIPDPNAGGAPEVEAPTPYGANRTTGTLTSAVRQYGPATGKDGHFVAFDVASAKGDVTRFLAQAAAGQVPKVGP
jgi:hypothetical protein